MTSKKRLLVLIYLAALVVSWFVMTNRRISLPQGSEWREIPIAANDGKLAMLRYRKFAGTNTTLSPLVLVHGSPMASSCFDPLLKSLSRERTILVPDLPGFGASSSGFSDFSFPAHAAALNVLLETENHKSAHWVAYSQGGGPLLDLSARKPAACDSLVLLSSIGVQEHELAGDYFLNHILHGTQWIALECLRWGLPHFGVLDDFLLNVRYARNFYNGDMRPLRGHLNKLTAPTLIIHGDTDGLVPPSAAREHFRIVPQSRIEWLKGGHMVLMSQDRAVTGMIDGFLKNVETGAAPDRSRAEQSRIVNATKPHDDKSMALSGMPYYLTMAAIALATLASEDLACLTAGLLAARDLIPLGSAIAAAFFGIFIGDMLLYLAGRYGGRWCVERAPLRWVLNQQKLDTGRDYLRKNGAMAVFITRFMPGTRLPLYVAAGVVKVSAPKVALWFMLAGLAWSIPVVSLTAFFGERAARWLLTNGAAVFPSALALIVLMWALMKMLTQLATHRGRRILWAKWQRLIRWEFWPPYVFYPPVVIAVFLMGLRRGKLLAFTAANPAMPHGGIAGESKADILGHLLPSGCVAPFLSLPAGAADKLEIVRKWNTGFPLVVKPDVGERGRDVVIVRDEASLVREIENRNCDTIIQQYVEGAEFGVFYIRQPNEERGHIFSITIKIMTSVTGNGTRTLEELILDDDRAVLSQQHFRKLHQDRLGEIPEAGEIVRLASLGSHCRGALFLNGSHLITPQLEAEIERIARTFDGFHFGRFDLRCPDEEALKRGEGIRLIELNGVTSEATHIYHPHTPLLTGYRTIISQWRHAIEIGNHNAKLGAYVSKWSEIMHLISRHFTPDRNMSATLAPPRYRIRTTRATADIRAAQRLRYAVFNMELGEGLDSSDHSGLDADLFDAQCDHIIIEEQETGEVIGTYRLQTGIMAAAGHGYYSATEFDFSPYESIRHQVLELGRACIRADHRNRTVLDLLWSGIARYAQSRNCRYLLGCSSLTSQNPQEGWGLYEQLAEKYLAPPHLQTQPIGQFIMPRPEEVAESVKTPKLFATYLSIGACIAGPPALDADFKTIDFLTILDSENMSSAGRKHFFKSID